jgi:hypothetical protein
LLRVTVHAHQLRHAADPHRIDPGDVSQLGRVEVVQLLQVVTAQTGEGANERRVCEA